MSQSLRNPLALLALLVAAAPALAGGGVVWTDLGGGLPGSTTPQLTLSGDFTEEAPALADVTGGPGAGRAFLFMGSSNASTPFLGGVLVPSTDLLGPFAIPTVGGAVQVAITAVGFPPGFEVYLQVWMYDPGGVQGASATNAWQGVL